MAEETAKWKCLNEACGYEGDEFAFVFIRETVQFPVEGAVGVGQFGHADVAAVFCCPKCVASSLVPLPLMGERGRRFAREIEGV